MRAARQKDNTLSLRHAAVFCVVFLVGTGVHYLVRPYVGVLFNKVLNAQVAAWLIDLVSPSEGVRAVGSSVGSTATSVQVAQGCEGVDVMLMLVAAIVAFPMAARRKVLGAVCGVLLIYAFNLGRIIALWYCLRFWPSGFDSLHLIVGQTVLILVGVIFFAFFTGVRGGAHVQPS